MSFIKNTMSGSNLSDSGDSWTIGKRITTLTISGAAITLIVGVLAIYAFYKVNNYTAKINKVYLKE